MKQIYTTILLCAAICFPLFAAVSDSSAKAKGSDDELILDDAPSTVLPATTGKTAVKQSASPSSPVADTLTIAKTAVSTVPVPAARVASPAVAPVVSPVKTGGGPAADAIPQKTAQPPMAKKPDTVKKIVDEDLILDGGEEDLLIQTKKVPAGGTPGGGANAAAGKKADSAAGKQGDALAADSSGLVGVPPVSQNRAAVPGSQKNPDSSAAHARQPKKAPAKIETARSINFAANLKEYRSPKLAMLMSLVLPGSGQVYAQSNWWAAGFLVVEAAIVGTGLVYSSKSKTQKANAHKFADTAYSADSFNVYAGNLRHLLDSKNDSTTYSSIFFDSSDVQFLSDAAKRNDNFYNDIGSETSPFLRGWRDVAPVFTQDGFGNLDPSVYHIYNADTNYLVYRYSDKANASYGFSNNQRHYVSMLDESRKLANYSRSAFVMLLVNHLASAVMAGIEAKNHNDALLGRESLWRHIDIEQQFVNTGSETVSGYSIGARF